MEIGEENTKLSSDLEEITSNYETAKKVSKEVLSELNQSIEVIENILKVKNVSS